MSTIKYIFSALVILSVSLSSCKKYLDAKPDARLSTPESLEELQLLLDNYEAWNNTAYPYGTEVLSDEFYLTTADYNAVTNQLMRDLYLFRSTDATRPLWLTPYQRIYEANLILAEADKIKVSAGQEANAAAIKGSALFYRGYFFYSVAQLFAPPYYSQTATTDPGIPLRLDADYEKVSVRASLQETYDRILTDLKTASLLLPKVTAFKTRPSKAAAYGAISKIYLSMNAFDSSARYAELSLADYGKDSLMNYNAVTTISSNTPFARFNREVIFHIKSQAATILANARAKIDSTLYNSYHTNDLRRTAYFRSNNNGTFQFKGDYGGTGTASGYLFAGITTDELYLIKAECLARAGQTTDAMATLNFLLEKRWRTGTFVPVAATTPSDALVKILVERRKELLRRGTRWSDLRRFKNDPVFTSTVKRIINNETVELKPDNPRYTLLIPAEVIALSGMKQNP